MNGANIFLVCGSGGVGKTTIAAALALKLARAGKKTIVLTIDPAKRLATALGIESLTDKPRKIPIGNTGGEMWAMMLDTKRTFDRLVERYASRPEQRNRILNNKIYQHMSGMLAGSQEYMAMERLYEIRRDGGYDNIVVDTPPMQSAIDFLEAPDRLANMISNSMIHLLLKPSLALGRAGFKFFEQGAQKILKILDRIVGFAFLQDISEMLIAFQDMLGGFEERARDVKTLLQSPESRFICVCTAEPHSIMETHDFAVKLKTMAYGLSGIIVNRVCAGPALGREKIEEDKKFLAAKFSAQDADILIANYRAFLPLIKRDAKALTSLGGLAGKGNVQSIPLFFSDIHDVNGLGMIADKLA